MLSINSRRLRPRDQRFLLHGHVRLGPRDRYFTFTGREQLPPREQDRNHARDPREPASWIYDGSINAPGSGTAPQAGYTQFWDLFHMITRSRNRGCSPSRCNTCSSVTERLRAANQGGSRLRTGIEALTELRSSILEQEDGAGPALHVTTWPRSPPRP